MNNTFLIIIFFWNIFLTLFILYIYLSSKKIFKGSSGKTLQEALQKFFVQSESLNNKVSKLEHETDYLKKEKASFFQKTAFLRFNPFGDTGGDQSFVWALLDEGDNGVVISSLHGRENTRVYAKLIRKGEIVNHKLSKEEQEVLSQAKISKK
ncbi:hypothetical protein A2X44_03680 [candidate division CPR3 bacterium GWF2_35_18]|uniref:DUF4446 domain-containing protein n=1 Tax=candidate division CPR3 bacterium GW2011_GWF2_35_18 TaxID=1618350 RepID=A0A0G0BJI1_UNCC3|nr:MAG: hypothetical protein UR67_C0004G0026 [candidate division CPR3 bacterium GW2011_GWF2_35_18]KKP87068.1 MAG: hypothetical protein UR87_C0005G0007 [candidate division CPR3 bacterium GW2011_GWE2_35_7]OGB63113.1 MAG: hypothetical protein A2X44_03680 [candidate division CPR3 bacterium GWF2_35_18]OGB64073.1 MAG: hypothetical protein A2250_04710 [candidate division CPR3 bacterium RIFOXYA2_FULL_35_13]OGB79625.1 MAG: hypothetical protein A2296_00925 [candidate division CPR3 bacterium RIFOXYB2_FULL